ncbi:hypothetical protein GCM10010517_23610 [Streptosporangium fragile]|uniref:Uncharacterized protein n=1 Tax=Streptosporangium fragile TaxID=46186 RepID=A0ABP6IB10_9ACTN
MTCGDTAARRVSAAWAPIAIAALIQWDAGGSGTEIILRPVVPAVKLLMSRPIDPPTGNCQDP